jgi:hypothetical protein
MEKEAPRNYDKIVNRDEITDAAVAAFANAGQQVPENYVRTEVVLDGVVVGKDESYELPVVDMARLRDPESAALEIGKLGDACRTWGFFQVRLLPFRSAFYPCKLNAHASNY